ncbi:hypothetical protein FB567DRAFT_27648 [Paraphoma chrysanthemicola]|uniref:Uncharacterized protein n=1 Tax=Paraphoma chrysanthemicola TaxID=798071 RepID=A0A8K0W4Z4_9PLEO|nr:hypothetical protein FB567DRAFT_27648 [Paraphoma chrysanthemicola]
MTVSHHTEEYVSEPTQKNHIWTTKSHGSLDYVALVTVLAISSGDHCCESVRHAQAQSQIGPNGLCHFNFRLPRVLRDIWRLESTEATLDFHRRTRGSSACSSQLYCPNTRSRLAAQSRIDTRCKRQREEHRESRCLLCFPAAVNIDAAYVDATQRVASALAHLDRPSIRVAEHVGPWRHTPRATRVSGSTRSEVSLAKIESRLHGAHALSGQLPRCSSHISTSA